MNPNIAEFEYVIVSDCHIGIRESKAKQLLDFLTNVKCQHLILNGDIFESFDRISFSRKLLAEAKLFIEKIFTLAENGVKISYIYGNHDKFVKIFHSVKLPNIEFCNKLIISHNGKNYIVTHGDKLDKTDKMPVNLVQAGSTAYHLIRLLNVQLNSILRLLKFKPVFISRQIKSLVKNFLGFQNQTKLKAIQLIRENKCHGIIYGHTHTPEIKQIGSYISINSGDWVEHLSYAAAKKDEEFALYFYNNP